MCLANGFSPKGSHSCQSSFLLRKTQRLFPETRLHRDRFHLKKLRSQVSKLVRGYRAAFRGAPVAQDHRQQGGGNEGVRQGLTPWQVCTPMNLFHCKQPWDSWDRCQSWLCHFLAGDFSQKKWEMIYWVPECARHCACGSLAG